MIGCRNFYVMEHTDKLLKVGWNNDRMHERLLWNIQINFSRYVGTMIGCRNVYVMEHTVKLIKVGGNIDRMQERLGTFR